jgi:hypothetical protein
MEDNLKPGRRGNAVELESNRKNIIWKFMPKGVENHSFRWHFNTTELNLAK